MLDAEYLVLVKIEANIVISYMFGDQDGPIGEPHLVPGRAKVNIVAPSKEIALAYIKPAWETHGPMEVTSIEVEPIDHIITVARNR